MAKFREPDYDAPNGIWFLIFVAKNCWEWRCTCCHESGISDASEGDMQVKVLANEHASECRQQPEVVASNDATYRANRRKATA